MWWFMIVRGHERAIGGGLNSCSASFSSMYTPSKQLTWMNKPLCMCNQLRICEASRVNIAPSLCQLAPGGHTPITQTWEVCSKIPSTYLIKHYEDIQLNEHFSCSMCCILFSLMVVSGTVFLSLWKFIFYINNSWVFTVSIISFSC